MLPILHRVLNMLLRFCIGYVLDFINHFFAFFSLLTYNKKISSTQYNQSSQGSQCNQAIMLITDGTTETHSEIIKRYNWPHRPVRIFTYLIGGGSSSRESMHSIACSNKGLIFFSFLLFFENRQIFPSTNENFIQNCRILCTGQFTGRCKTTSCWLCIGNGTPDGIISSRSSDSLESSVCWRP